MSITDPLGLLDRDLTNYDTAYDTCVSNATERERIMVDWYREFAGHDPADSDMAHGEWRISVERLRWLTMRGALQEAWPLPAQPMPPSPNPPPVGDMRRLVPQHHYFVKDGGERFTVICATDFCLQKMCCGGLDVHPVLAQRQACGFNMVRVFIAQDWGDSAYRVRPDQHPNYYERLADLAQSCSDHGLYLMACAFADHGAFSSDQARLDHWARTADVLRPHPNVLLELVNENNITGSLDPNLFAKPDGLVASHGSNGSQTLAVRPWWDWEAFHTNGAPEEQRKIGHNAMELADGTPDWPGSHVPVITNETSRYWEVGMWNRPLGEQQMLAYDSAAGAALQCAGSCFHSVNGKLSLLWTPNEEAVARSWAAGALSVPLEYQDGRYQRIDDLAANELRKYRRVLGDGRFHEVVIHK